MKSKAEQTGQAGTTSDVPSDGDNERTVIARNPNSSSRCSPPSQSGIVTAVSGEFRLGHLSPPAREEADDEVLKTSSKPPPAAARADLRGRGPVEGARSEEQAVPTQRACPRPESAGMAPALGEGQASARGSARRVELSTAGGSHAVLEQRLQVARDWLERLDAGDLRRTTLEVAIFRRDNGLLSAVLAALEDGD